MSEAPKLYNRYYRHYLNITKANGCKGWLTVAGWQACLASSAYVLGLLVQGLIEVVNRSYTPQLWHATLLLYAALAVAIFTTTVVGTILPKVESILLVVYVLGFFGVLVPLVYLGPHGNAKDVFSTFLNNGGWSSQGLSVMVGLSGNAFAFLGTYKPDCSSHIADPASQAPTLFIMYVSID